MKQNKREIPQEFKPARQRDENSPIFGYTKDLTLVSYVICHVSYVPKKNKSVVLSSHHHDSAICGNSGQPEIIEFYKRTKGEIDVLDQMCARYREQLADGQWQ